MAIILKSYKVIRDKAGKEYVVDRKIIRKWSNEHNFGFDTFDVREWRKYLSNYRLSKSGKLLPRKSPSGDKVIYEVHSWGTATWMRDALPDIVNQKNSWRVVSFFPGYSKDGEKRDITKYGVLLD